MSKYADKLFWVIMAVIIVAIALLSYITFFSQPSSTSPKTENQEQSPAPEPQKVQDLYVCVEEAKIRSAPEGRGKIIQSAKKGDPVAVIGEKQEWFKVMVKEGTTGWIEKKSVCDQRPQAVEKTKPEKEKSKPAPAASQPSPKKKTEKSTEEKALPAIGGYAQNYPPEAAGTVENLIDGLLNRVNSTTQMRFGQTLFADYTILDAGMRLEIKVTNTWNLLPQPLKTQVLRVLADQYTIIACNRIVSCTANNTPSVSLINASGREVAYQNPTGSQILE